MDITKILTSFVEEEEDLITFIMKENETGYTALMFASEEGNEDVVDYLLTLLKTNDNKKLIKSIMHQNKFGDTALMVTLKKLKTGSHHHWHIAHLLVITLKDADSMIIPDEQEYEINLDGYSEDLKQLLVQKFESEKWIEFLMNNKGPSFLQIKDEYARTVGLIVKETQETIENQVYQTRNLSVLFLRTSTRCLYAHIMISLMKNIPNLSLVDQYLMMKDKNGKSAVHIDLLNNQYTFFRSLTETFERYLPKIEYLQINNIPATLIFEEFDSHSIAFSNKNLDLFMIFSGVTTKLRQKHLIQIVASYLRIKQRSCHICYENLYVKKFITLNCGHDVFCEKCISKCMIFHSPECPLCRIDFNSSTVLIDSLRRGDILTAKFILKKRPNARWENDNGIRPLILAVEKGFEDIVILLFEKSKDDCRGYNYKELVSRAYERATTEMKKLLASKLF